MKELSPEKRKKLYDNLGKSILEFHSMMPLYLVASEQCSHPVYKVILRCGYTILYSITDISSLFRAEMREPVIIGKRFGIVKLKIAVSEVFKAIVGTNFDDSKALYSQIRTSIETDYANECLGIDKSIVDFRENYWTKQVKDARDVAEHFSDKPYEYYQLILSADEDLEAKRINAILAIIQPLFAIISKIVNRENLLANVDSKEVLNYSGSFAPILENLTVDSRYDELGKLMTKEAANLDKFAYNFNLPKVIEEKFGSFELNESIQYMLQLCELMMHLEFVRLDTAYTYRAICSSELPVEQRLNLRLMYKTNHEGFKKLYGFKDDKSGTIWGTKIEPQMQGYGDVIRKEYESIKLSLNLLSRQTGINDEHLVVVLTHLRKNKNKDYISDALIELGNLNLRNIMGTSILFLNVLNKIINLTQMMLPEIKKRDEELHQRDMDKLFRPMYDLIDKIKGSDMDDANKKNLSIC